MIQTLPLAAIHILKGLLKMASHEYLFNLLHTKIFSRYLVLVLEIYIASLPPDTYYDQMFSAN